MSSSYNFKDNLTINNNKYLKWLDITGTSRSNVITLDNLNNVNLNSSFGDFIVTSAKFMFLNVNNTNGLFIGSKVGVGINSTANIGSDLTIIKDGFIGINTTMGSNNGFLGLVGGCSLSNTSGSRILLHGNDTNSSGGQLHLFSGNNTNGNINFYTRNDSLKCQILSDGTFNIIPDGITSRLNINNSRSLFSNDIVITSTTQSYNVSTGSLVVNGGIGVGGNLYVDGAITVNSTSGNINFDSYETSSSYTTGAIVLNGGIGITSTANSSSITSGGAMSIAGGIAVGKDVYIGGKLTIIDSSIPSSSQTGSMVLYGGLGLNGPIWLRNNDSSQIKLSSTVIGNETSLAFYSSNNFGSTNNTGSSWIIGQNVNGIGSGNFNLYNSNYGNVFSCTYNGYVGISSSIEPSNIFQVGNGGRLLVANTDGDYTLIGTSNIDSDFNTKIILNGNTKSSEAGTIKYTSTATGSHIWYTTNDKIERLILYSSGNLQISNTETAIGVGSGGSLTVLGGASINKALFIGGPVLKIPSGDTSARPLNPEAGLIRFNIQTNEFEGYSNTWGSLGSGNITGGNITGGDITSGSLYITTTENSIGVGTGGGLTVLGGASISKDVYVGGAITSFSDIRLKTNIRSFKKDGDKFLDKIDNIRSILFNYKTDMSLGEQVGFIAQDFIENFPQLLRCANSEGYYSLDYQKVSVVLLECIKELYNEINEIKELYNEIKK
jgi:hypothetical protein